MSHFGTPLRDFHADATLDCACGLPMFPVGWEGVRYDHGTSRSDVAARRGAAERQLRYECANAHVRVVPTPTDARLRRLIDNWIDRRSSQLEEQHRRWEADGR